MKNTKVLHVHLFSIQKNQLKIKGKQTGSIRTPLIKRMFKRTLNFLEHEMDPEGQQGFRCDEMGRIAQPVHRTQQAELGGGKTMVTTETGK